MNEREAKASLHAMRISSNGRITVELLGPMLQQFDLMALSEALEESVANAATDQPAAMRKQRVTWEAAPSRERSA